MRASVNFEPFVDLISLSAFLFMFLEQITLFEKSSIENEITEIYQQTDLNVMQRNRTFWRF